jgi:serine-type D-Ala-D-Ala carboxypeptidase/endopeptidase (penicillin-binding protein 4)
MIIPKRLTGDLARKLSILFLSLLLHPFPLWAQIAATASQAEAKPQSQAELQARVTALLEQPKFAPARWGIRIITTDGRAIFERDADKLFMPASNMKLYTTAAALDALGPDHKFKTSVYSTGIINSKGTLRGNLILYGRGDPNMSARFDLNEAGNPNPIDEYTPTDKFKHAASG